MSVRPLQKINTGEYLTADGKHRIIHADARRKLCWSVQRADGKKSLTYTKTLKDAVARLEGVPAPYKIRPLQTHPYRDLYPQSRWFSSCGQLVFSKDKLGWKITICNVPLPKENLDRAREWKMRHGLDIGLPTLKEVADRAEKALEIDPLGELLNPPAMRRGAGSAGSC